MHMLNGSREKGGGGSAVMFEGSPGIQERPKKGLGCATHEGVLIFASCLRRCSIKEKGRPEGRLVGRTKTRAPGGDAKECSD